MSLLSNIQWFPTAYKIKNKIFTTVYKTSSDLALALVLNFISYRFLNHSIPSSHNDFLVSQTPTSYIRTVTISCVQCKEFSSLSFWLSSFLGLQLANSSCKIYKISILLVLFLWKILTSTRNLGKVT